MFSADLLLPLMHDKEYACFLDTPYCSQRCLLLVSPPLAVQQVRSPNRLSALSEPSACQQAGAEVDHPLCNLLSWDWVWGARPDSLAALQLSRSLAPSKLGHPALTPLSAVQGYLAAVSASAYSYVSMVQRFAPIMNAGGAVVSLTYLASEKIIPGLHPAIHYG